MISGGCTHQYMEEMATDTYVSCCKKFANLLIFFKNVLKNTKLYGNMLL